MRWTHKFYETGDRRLKEKFLFFPKRIGEDVRWLEFAVWEDVYEGGRDDCYWRPNKWLSK